MLTFDEIEHWKSSCSIRRSYVLSNLVASLNFENPQVFLILINGKRYAYATIAVFSAVQRKKWASSSHLIPYRLEQSRNILGRTLLTKKHSMQDLIEWVPLTQMLNKSMLPVPGKSLKFIKWPSKIWNNNSKIKIRIEQTEIPFSI